MLHCVVDLDIEVVGRKFVKSCHLSLKLFLLITLTVIVEKL